MKAHFFDLDVILEVNAMIWIIDKSKPNIPIMKINKSDFNLIKNGIYKYQNNGIKFNGDNYWFPEEVFNDLKIKTKKHKSDISNLAFSMQEFLNKDIIEHLEYNIKLENILHLKNTNDDIYIISSKNTKERHDIMISKIEDELKENGLNIKKYYYISETFYNRNLDDIAHKKVRLLLQHLVGYKTDGNVFIDEDLNSYSEINYYDTDDNSIKLAKSVNKLLMFISENSEDYLKNIIKDNIKEFKPKLIVNEITSNRMNKFIKNEIELKYSNLIKVYENFVMLNEKKKEVDIKTSIKYLKIPKEYKEFALRSLKQYSKAGNGKITGLNLHPDLSKKITEKDLPRGFDMGVDKNGYYIHTHRARSKSHENPADITIKEIRFVDSTG
jgi:hypothetical protein